MEINKLHEHINNSPLVKAAIIEAVHRFYYDRILSDRKIDQKDLSEYDVANILDTLWNILPDWRHILHTLPGRYASDGPTTSIPIYCKPKQITPLEIIIIIK